MLPKPQTRARGEGITPKLSHHLALERSPSHPSRKAGIRRIENRGCAAEQTQTLPVAALHQVSLLRASASRSPSPRSHRGSRGPSSRHPTSSPGSPRLPSRQPSSPSPRPSAHLALHLHGAQAAAAHPVPVATVHAERPAGGALVWGPSSGARAAGPRSAGSGLEAQHGASSRHLLRSAQCCARCSVAA